MDLEILYMIADKSLHFNELWRRLRERGITISKRGLRSRIEKLKLLNILNEKVVKQYKIMSIIDENIRRVVLAVYKYCEYIDRTLSSISDIRHIQSLTKLLLMLNVYTILFHTLLVLNVHKVMPEEIYRLLTDKLIETYMKTYSHFLTLTLNSVKTRQELTKFILQLYDSITISEEDEELRQVLDNIKSVITTILGNCWRKE